MKRRLVSMLGAMLLLAITMVNAEDAVIMVQKNPPLQITTYSAKYESEVRGNYISHPDQIEHALKYKNVSDKVIVAMQIGLVSFDAFNNFMDRLNGWAFNKIAIGAEAKGAWNQRPYDAFSFQKYGTGFAFVSAVRFEDGSIWLADLEEILEGLQKFEKGLKKEDLEEKKK